MNDPLEKIISVTELRRNFGEITAGLIRIDELILTKGGQPFAVLKPAPAMKKKLLLTTAGAWKDTAADSDKIWLNVAKKKSRKSPVKL